MYPKYSASAAAAADGAQPTPPAQPKPHPPPPPPPPPRARLSSFDIDRHFEARLRCLSPAPPVALFLPAPRDDELRRRFERLQAGHGGDGAPVDEAELARRLKRLQGEEADEADDRKEAAAAASGPLAPQMPAPVYADAGDELESLLRRVQDEVKVDYAAVCDTATQLTRPLDSIGAHRQRRGGRQRNSGDKEMEGKGAAAGVDADDDVDQLMHELQRLPDTAVVKLKSAAGSSYHSDEDHEDSSDDAG